MYFFLKFTHIIMAMVYFGLPITFRRWYRSGCEHPGPGFQEKTLKQLRTLTGLHLNLCAVFLGISGLLLIEITGRSWQTPWLLFSMIGFLFTILNINCYLLPALMQAQPGSNGKKSDPRSASLQKRIAIFSAVHHTLVTLITALMVVKPINLL